MHTVATPFHTAHRLGHNDTAAPACGLGTTITLCSAVVPRLGCAVRSWYLTGDFGSIHTPHDDDKGLLHLEGYLAANGFTRRGDLPPECFEYARDTK